MLVTKLVFVIANYLDSVVETKLDLETLTKGF